jgi:hypothetical protein
MTPVLDSPNEEEDSNRNLNEDVLDRESDGINPMVDLIPTTEQNTDLQVTDPTSEVSKEEVNKKDSSKADSSKYDYGAE